MQMQLAVPIAMSAIGLTLNAQAAPVSGRDRDNILAACSQTHDTCLQSCNAAHPTNEGLFKRADNFQRTDGCNAACSKCTNSVNFQSNQSNGQKKKKTGVLDSN